MDFDPREEGIKNFKKKMMEKRRSKRFDEEGPEMGVSVESDSPEGLEKGLEKAQEMLPDAMEMADKAEGFEREYPESEAELGEDMMEDDMDLEGPGGEENESLLRGIPVEEIEAFLEKMKAEEFGDSEMETEEGY